MFDGSYYWLMDPTIVWWIQSLCDRSNHCAMDQIIVQGIQLLCDGSNHCVMDPIIVRWIQSLCDGSNHCVMDPIIVQWIQVLCNGSKIQSLWDIYSENLFLKNLSVDPMVGICLNSLCFFYLSYWPKMYEFEKSQFCNKIIFSSSNPWFIHTLIFIMN